MCVNDRRRAKRRERKEARRDSGCQERSETERPEGDQSGRAGETRKRVTGRQGLRARKKWKKDTPAKGRSRKRE